MRNKPKQTKQQHLQQQQYFLFLSAFAPFPDHEEKRRMPPEKRHSQSWSAVPDTAFEVIPPLPGRSPSEAIHILPDEAQHFPIDFKQLLQLVRTGKSVLVTGAAGFVGANLVMALLRKNPDIQIVGLDNLNDYYDVGIKEYRLAQIEQLAGKSGHAGQLNGQYHIRQSRPFLVRQRSYRIVPFPDGARGGKKSIPLL